MDWLSSFSSAPALDFQSAVDLQVARQVQLDRYKKESEILSNHICKGRLKLKLLVSISAKIKARQALHRERYSSLEQYCHALLDSEFLDPIIQTATELKKALRKAEWFRAVLAKTIFIAESPLPDHGVELSVQRVTMCYSPTLNYYALLHSVQLDLYQQKLHDDLQTLIYELQSIEDYLDRQKEEVERLARLSRQAASRLQVNFEFLLVPCKASKFTDGDEPTCMTMPWNILPALMVLWGVCWMFYNSYGCSAPTPVQYSGAIADDNVSGIDFLHGSDNELLWGPGPDMLLTAPDTLAGQWMLPDANSVSPQFVTFPGYQAVDAVNFADGGYEYVGGPRGDPFGASDPISNGVPSRSISENPSTSVEHTRPLEPSLAQYPPRSSAQPITCPHVECSGARFDQVVEWKKHDERVHNRHKCVVAGCDKSFGSKGVLHRHEETVHNQLPLHKLLHCPITDCRYSQALHFKRKDHLTNHLKSMHYFNAADAKVRADAQARVRHRPNLNRQTVPQLPSASELQRNNPAIVAITPSRQDTPSEPFGSATSEVSQRQRLEVDSIPVEGSTAMQTATVHDELAMWKAKAAKLEAESGLIRARESSLQTRIESLESEVVRLRKCEESLLAIVLAATKKS